MIPETDPEAGIPSFLGLTFIARRQYLLAYAMAVALMAFVTAVYTFSSWDKASNREERQLEALVALEAEAIDNYFSVLERSLADLADRLGARPGPQSHDLLAAYKRRYPEYQIIVLSRPDGEILATSETPTPGRSFNIGDEPSFVAARDALVEGAQMVVSRSQFGVVSQRWVTPLRYGIRDAQGRLVLILGGGLQQARAHEFWKDAPLPPGAAMGLIRDDFYVVARHPTQDAQAEAVFAKPVAGLLTDHLRENPGSASGVVRGFGQVSSEDVTVAYRRLQHHPLTFFVTNPLRNLETDWRASAWPTYVLLAVLFVGGISIIRWIGLRQDELQHERDRRVGELEDLAARLRQANTKLEATNAEQEAFMYSVSHDFRAPLRAIGGFSALVRDELAVSPDSVAGRYFDRIQANAKRMAELLDDLLDLSRYSALELQTEDLDMRAAVDAAVAELASEPHRARFEIGDLPRCRGDRNLVHQVWFNLVANAIKYSADAPEPVVRIGFEDGAYFVADNGAGFDMAYAGKLFKLFSRLHAENEYGGNGIGLSIVKRIVERHGGRIEARGAVGAGARFTFTLNA